MNCTGVSPALTWVRVMIEEKMVRFKARGAFGIVVNAWPCFGTLARPLERAH